jgi:hypothetical protein
MVCDAVRWRMLFAGQGVLRCCTLFAGQRVMVAEVVLLGTMGACRLQSKECGMMICRAKGMMVHDDLQEKECGAER